MSQMETASMIANQRMVTAGGLLENRADLRGYPFRYVAVHSYTLMRGEGLRVLMAAVELLEQFGWTLVNIVQIDKNLYAIMGQPPQRPAS